MAGIALDGWSADPEATFFPQGARDKRSFISPADAASADRTLLANHRYIFKKSTRHYPEEFWSEIVAARIGDALGVVVPPAYPAWHEGLRECGALIEFFHGKPGDPRDIVFEHGGDLCVRWRPAFDRRRGTAHSVELLIQVSEDLARNGLRDDFRTYWGRVFLFDAIIGNSDRHQDNWGVLRWIDSADGRPRIRFAPAYDNGASLGREIQESRIAAWRDREIDAYIARGTHHLRWHDDDRDQCRHADLVRRWIERFPECRTAIAESLNAFELPDLSDMRALRMPDFVPPLSERRSEFVLELVRRRCDKLRAALAIPPPTPRAEP